jgi:hypothetical protein
MVLAAAVVVVVVVVTNNLSRFNFLRAEREAEGGH